MTRDCRMWYLLLLLHHCLERGSVGDPKSETWWHWYLLTWLAVLMDLIRDLRAVWHQIHSWRTGYRQRIHLWMLMILAC
jgi:hypothetical protein